MSARVGKPSSYPAQVVWFAARSVAQLVRPPTHSRRADAARRLSRHSLLITAIAALAIALLMYSFDATAIDLMPVRGTASLWPIRIFTDFGKSAYILSALGAVLLVIALVAPRLRGLSRSILFSLGTRIQFLFLAVAVPIIAGDLVKGLIGRGRPFASGEANPFFYSHLAWTERFASFPSGHAVASFALAFAVSAVWPRLSVPMFIYAGLIAVSRLVLLAHHPSDVVAGALIGVVGAMGVRHWFAARRLVFTIRQDGAVEPCSGPSLGQLKRVARAAFAPYEADALKRT